MTQYFGASQGAVSRIITPTDSQLLGLWGLDETGGSTAADSQLGNTGTYQGSPTLGTSSLLEVGGNSVSFDGSTSYLVIPHISAYAVSSYTLFLTQRPTSAPPFNRVIFSKAGLPHIGEVTIEQVMTGGVSMIRSYIQDDLGVIYWIGPSDATGAAPLPIGSIRQILLEVSPAGAKLYLRAPAGEWEEVASNVNAITGWTQNLEPIHLASYPPDAGLYHGLVDQLRIYSGLLTAAEKDNLPRPVVSASFTLASMETFSVGQQRLTTVPGWSGTPKEIASQGQHVHAYLRRPVDYGPNNDGTYIDLIAGSRKTINPDTIQVRLTDDSVVDLSISVTRGLPGGAKTLDNTGADSPTFTTWNSMLTSVVANDNVLIRARAGTRTDLAGYSIPNFVYDVTSKPSSSVNTVKLIAHPDDVAASRKPVIMWEGNRYARYVYSLAQNPWELHQTLGDGSTIWRTKEVHPAASTYCGFYKTSMPKQQPGDPDHTWVALFSPRHPSQTSRLAVLQDITYPRVSDWGAATQPYRGPSLIQEPDGRFYVRLSPPVQQVIQNPAAGAPWPTWGWQDYYPDSANPNQVPIFIAVGDVGAYSNRNWLLGMAGRSGWEVENISFFFGNTAIFGDQCTNILPKFRGLYTVGGCTGDFFLSSDGQHAIDASSGMASTLSSQNFPSVTQDGIFEQSYGFGGIAPWMSWMDGKGGYGPGGQACRREFISTGRTQFIYRNCVFSDFYHFMWLPVSPGPIKNHFVHCLLRNWGSQDGAFVSSNLGHFVISRSRGEYIVPSGIAGSSGQLFTITNSILLNHAAYMITWGGGPTQTIYCSTWPGSYESNVPSLPPGIEIGHGSNSGADGHHAQSLFIGCHSSNGSNLFGGNTQGYGSGMTPGFRGWSNYALTNSKCFNNIGVLVSSPYPSRAGRSACVAGYAGNPSTPYNFNYVWKVPGTYPTPGSGGLTTFVMGGTGSSATGYASLTALASALGHETNGTEGNPGFVGTDPAYPLTSPFVPGGAFDLSRYLLGPGAGARTGGSAALSSHSIIDYDIYTSVTYAGKLYRGPLAPDVPMVEQRIGLLCPPPVNPA